MKNFLDVQGTSFYSQYGLCTRFQHNTAVLTIKSSGKVHHRTAHEGPEGE